MTFFGCDIPTIVVECNVQENYFGEDDMYTDFEESLSSPVLSSCSSSSGWTRVGLEENRSKDAPHPLLTALGHHRTRQSAQGPWTPSNGQYRFRGDQ